jgi:HEPN domain-containing protein
MPNPDPEVAKKVMQWLTFADEDLKIACDAMNYGSGGPYRLIAYHAQQCAEKCLKAYLVFHSEDFPYTHNIRRLLKLCGKHATWPQNIEDAEELTPYAITTRYPGEDAEVTRDEAVSAIDIAQKVRDRVWTELKLLGMDLIE